MNRLHELLEGISLWPHAVGCTAQLEEPRLFVVRNDAPSMRSGWGAVFAVAPSAGLAAGSWIAAFFGMVY